MRSREAFAYSRSTGYFCSVAALPTTANKEKAPAARPGRGWDSCVSRGHRGESNGNGRPLSTTARFLKFDGCDISNTEPIAGASRETTSSGVHDEAR